MPVSTPSNCANGTLFMIRQHDRFASLMATYKPEIHTHTLFNLGVPQFAHARLICCPLPDPKNSFFGNNRFPSILIIVTNHFTIVDCTPSYRSRYSAW